jgi:MFS family permease
MFTLNSVDGERSLPKSVVDPESELAPHPPGSIGAAWASRPFRRLYVGSTLSLVGTWLQNVVVAPYALDLTRTPSQPKGSASFVGLLTFAQLGPLLLLSIPGGVLANRIDRKKLMIVAQTIQAIAAFALAFAAWKLKSPVALFLATMVIGTANALSAPTTSSVLPELVEPRNIGGAISLNSATMNGSRSVAPIIVLALTGLGFSASGFFFLNAISYFALIVALWGLPMRRRIEHRGSSGKAAFLDGIREARANPVAGRVLFLLFSLSLFSLPFIGQFATIVERAFHTESKRTYLILFAVWGCGAALGALSIGTVLVKQDQRKLVSAFLTVFAVALGAWSFVSSPVVAFPVAFVLGFAYFGSTTAMSSVLQSHLDQRRRAPVMALWFMAFGGTVPFGAMWGGWTMDHWSVRGTLLIGTAWLVVLVGLSRDLPARSARQQERMANYA